MAPNLSTKLRFWVERFCRKHDGGTQLPTGSELARAWNLSPRTVASVLKQVERTGVLVRIPGKGSFVAPYRPNTRLTGTPAAETSTDSLAALLELDIRKGHYRDGDALPSVKFLANRYRVGKATVTSAYRRLSERQLIVKIGKTFWVRYLDQPAPERTPRDVYLFVEDEHELENIYTPGSMGRMFRTCDTILSRNGFLLRVAFKRDIRRCIDRWQSDRHAPYGIIAVRVSASQNELMSQLERIRTLHAFSAVRIVVNWQGAPEAKLPARWQVFSGMGRHGDRYLGRYLVSRSYEYPVVVMDADIGRSDFSFYGRDWDFVYLFDEMHSLDPSHLPRLAYINPDGTLPEIFDDIWGRRAVQRELKRGSGAIFETMHRRLSVFPTVEAAFSAFREADMWVAQSDTIGKEILDLAGRHRVLVPDRASIITLDDNPRYYPIGLSHLERDWENYGYLMAHAIIGDFELPKDEYGFVAFQSRVLEKMTTRRR